MRTKGGGGITSLILCGGFPRCGTTTVASIIGELSGCVVHPEKEPHALVAKDCSLDHYLSSFSKRSGVRYLVDFSTRYGIGENRATVFESLRACDLARDARIVVCVRDPVAQAKSNLLHKLRKTKLSIGEDDIAALDLIVEKILEEQAYEAAISDFSAMLSPGRVFVVKFDDLLTELGQRSVAGKLANWLEVPPPLRLSGVKYRNAATDARFYPGWRGDLIRLLKVTGIHRAFSFEARNQFRQVFGRRHSAVHVSADTLSKLTAELPESRRLFYRSVRTGCAEMADELYSAREASGRISDGSVTL